MSWRIRVDGEIFGRLSLNGETRFDTKEEAERIASALKGTYAKVEVEQV